MHGASSPQAKRKAAERIATQRAEAAVVTYGLPRDVAPDVALLEEVARTAGHVDWLAGVVREFEADDLVWGRTRRDEIGASEFDGVNVTEQAAPNVWLELYHRERAHLVKVCAAAIGAGIAERQVRIAERQGALIADLLRAVFADLELGLSEGQRKAAPGVVRRHLAVLRSA